MTREPEADQIHIGGAMASTWTAIADPIFYFGAHWHIDRVFDDHKLIRSEQNIRPLDRETLRETNALESEEIALPDEFTAEQLRQIREDIELSKRIRTPL